MKLLVCGGRDFEDYDLLKTVLSVYHVTKNITEVIHGDARGADRLADLWAERHRIPVRKFPADWQTHGKAAGPIRNQRMIDEGKPDMVLGFRGGRGTADMFQRAEAAGIEWSRI